MKRSDLEERRVMRFNYPKSIVKTAVIALAILLPIAGVARAQTVSLSLTAAEQTAVQPDGVSIPMWGWVCGAVTGGGSCTAANGAPQTGGTTWQPVATDRQRPAIAGITDELTPDSGCDWSGWAYFSSHQHELSPDRRAGAAGCFPCIHVD